MISIPEIAIRRPVFTWMLMFALILFGAISFRHLGISQLPDVDFPVLNVTVNWEGAAPEVLESEIVDEIEEEVVAIEGIREITSSIRQGQVSVSLEFELERDIDSALQEVQSAMSRIKLPTNVNPPTIRKSNPEDQPIIWIGVSSNTRSAREIINFVDLELKDRFETLPGVGEVTLGGFTERNLRVWVRNADLKRLELTILDIRDALERGNLETAAGTIEGTERELNLRVMGEGISPEDVGNLLILARGGRPIYGSQIRIRDVARVEDGLADIRRISRVNGTAAIGLGIKKQRGSNAVLVGQLVKAKIKEIATQLPEDMLIGVNFDSTVFVEESIAETEFTLVLSALATAVVCFLFLGSFWPTFNILLSIPTSIIGTLSVIYFMGFTLNFFTILGLALAIGIVVDDAIMVLENIYRHRAMGKNRVQASIDGAREITFAALAATIAVIAIFLPVAFMKGVIGKFFFQFGVTISAAVALSLVEAITLTPMRCSQFMEDTADLGWFARFLNSVFARISVGYRFLLQICLKFRWLVLLGSIGLFLASLALLRELRMEFIPAQDQSMFITRIETPVGSSLEFTSEAMRQAEQLLLNRPETRRIYAAIGGFGGGEVNTGMLFVSLKPRGERDLAQEQVMAGVREELGKVPNIRAFVQDLSTRGFTAQRGFPVEFNIRGGDWKVLSEKSAQIVKQLSDTGLVVDLNTDYRLGQPEVRVWPLRDEAFRRGVSVESITETVATAIGGTRQGKFTQGGRRYDVRLRLEGDERVKAEDILNLQLRNVHGELVPIREVVKLENTTSLQTITRRNRERSISIYANVAPGKSQAEALSVGEKIAQEILPPGYHVVIGGGAQTFRESFSSLSFVLWLGVVVAYMVLASQFNSFVHPFTVLLALPFSLTGAFAALYLSNQSLNLYSMIGIILLMGIVKKNSILLVEFTNHKRYEEGLPLQEAILAASPIRLRPILMTSFATLAAAFPPALALGPGAESRVPMAITVLGGVIVSTFFTLFVVPCAYSVFAALEKKRSIT